MVFNPETSAWSVRAYLTKHPDQDKELFLWKHSISAENNRESGDW